MKVREALAAAAGRLATVTETPRLDAELLMAHALSCTREEMLLSGMDDPAPDPFEPLIDRRFAHEPVAYITGRRAFWTIELEVGPGVLVPRSDSETLLEAALEHFRDRAPRTILDLGTGPGTLLLAALDQWPAAIGVGVDRSDEALAYARRNAERLGLSERSEFQLGDWAKGVEGSFDLILCNPPYVEADADLPRDVAEWEPPQALFAGVDGLDEYRRLAPQLRPLLSPGGIACLEIGAGQADAVSLLLAQQAFTISSRPDLKGVPRALILSVDRE
jgi:release factor glutamine methyltransferase